METIFRTLHSQKGHHWEAVDCICKCKTFIGKQKNITSLQGTLVFMNAFLNKNMFMNVAERFTLYSIEFYFFYLFISNTIELKCIIIKVNYSVLFLLKLIYLFRLIV